MLGQKSIGYYEEIIKTLQEDKDTPKDEQYYRSIINSKINIAKGTAKLMSSDRDKRVVHLKHALALYHGIIDYITKDVP